VGGTGAHDLNSSPGVLRTSQSGGGIRSQQMPRAGSYRGQSAGRGGRSLRRSRQGVVEMLKAQPSTARGIANPRRRTVAGGDSLRADPAGSGPSTGSLLQHRPERSALPCVDSTGVRGWPRVVRPQPRSRPAPDGARVGLLGPRGRERTERVRAAAAAGAVHFYRQPCGLWNRPVLDKMHRLGLSVLRWSDDPQNWGRRPHPDRCRTRLAPRSAAAGSLPPEPAHPHPDQPSRRRRPE